jgi:hypothetical protein
MEQSAFGKDEFRLLGITIRYMIASPQYFAVPQCGTLRTY